MPTMTQGARTGEHIISEANGRRSRETVTIVAGNDLAAGTVLGKITASGKYAPYSDAATDGTEAAACVLYANVDASAADKEAVVHERDTEVDEAALTGLDANGKADLEAKGIIFR